MNEDISLIDHCVPCEAKCCQSRKAVGVPILSEEEALIFKEKFGVKLKKEETPNGVYYVFQDWLENKKCPFLTSKHTCKTQEMKPLDCLAYPLIGIPQNGSVRFLIDPDCPAVKHLDQEYIEKVKMISLQSLRRFPEETYKHWLDNYIGWIKEGKEV
ncbi:MAG: hypothetical protein ABIJ92_03345 [Candidatus Aenigmatarchaeota archaeon]